MLEVSALGLDVLLCYSKINVTKFQSLSIGSLSVVMIGCCHHSLFHLGSDSNKTPGLPKLYKK